MFDYRGELERRIAQFASFLRPMNHRAHEIAYGPCFMIFEERRPEGNSEAALVEKRELALHHGEDVEGHDPFRKIYIYGDEESAAQDMAFVFFQVWKFPVESGLFVNSAAFSGKHQWEQSVAIE